MAVIRPRDEPELAEAVAASVADRRRLEICGAASKRDMGRPVVADDILDLSALSGILRYDPEELVVTLRAGTPLRTLAAELAEHHQGLGFDPADWGALFGGAPAAGTIGGALAADLSGTRRVVQGAAREHLLGLRAVNGWGKPYKAGGKVVKNVTGFDICKLMCGSYGILGPMSEVTLKLVPRPPLSLCLAVRDVGAETGLGLLRRIWGEPLEATGLLYIPGCSLERFDMYGGSGAGVALLRIEGSAEALSDTRNLLQSLLEGRHGLELNEGDAVFTRAANGGIFAHAPFDLWRLAVPPAASVEVANALAGTIWYADWAGALFWIATSGETAAAAASLRRIGLRAGGQLHLLRADSAARRTLGVLSTPPGGVLPLMRAVKAAFDPLALFNPGRLFEGL